MYFSMLGFFLPLYSLSVVVGIEWSIYKILPLLVLFYGAVIRGYAPRVPPELRITLYFSFLYMCLTTLVVFESHLSQGRFDGAILLGGDAVRVFGHMPIQLLSMLLVLAFIPFLSCLRNPEKNFIQFLNGFHFGVNFSIFVGFSVFILANAGVTLSEALPFGRYEVRGRIGGLSGEPRHFGAIIVLGILLLLIVKEGWIQRNKRRRVFAGVSYGVALLGTLSTSAWLGFLIALGMWVILSDRPNQLKITWKKRVISLGAVLFAAGMFSIYSSDLIHERLLDRVQSVDQALYFVPKDALAFDYMRSKPVILVFGAGAGGLDYFLMDPRFLQDVRASIVNTTQVRSILGSGDFTSALTPSAFWPRWVSYFGLVGFVVLLLILRKMVIESRGGTFGDYVRKLAWTMIPAAMILSTLSVIIAIYFIFFMYMVQRKNRGISLAN